MAVSEKSLMQAMWENSYLSAGDDYIDDLYEQFLQDPASVSPSWQQYFSSLATNPSAEVSHQAIRERFLRLAQQRQKIGTVSPDADHEHKQALVEDLIYAYRSFGHLEAKLDPLRLSVNPAAPQLDPKFYGFTSTDLQSEFAADQIDGGKPVQLQRLIDRLRQIYCGTIGAEYMHISDQNELQWLQQRLESGRPVLAKEKQQRVLACLTAAEGLEKYLGTKYVGQKRFSLEGGESLILLLDELLERGSSKGIKEVVIGMAHRGRLNVLVNILGKDPQVLFAEFEGKNIITDRSGDVKYHLGFASNVQTKYGSLHLALAFNPSHLEIVSPVVAGSVRARQERLAIAQTPQQILPVQIHGDAAFAGQGVVAETFALSQTKGYGIQGSVHIVINNQIGFTTDPIDARSTRYCTDVAKMVQIPIFHVNADDPDAVIFVTQLALDYRETFHKDIVIDLVCYRRHGHNEADEPAATQPVMYQKIKQQPTTRQLYAEQLIASGAIDKAVADQWQTDYRDALDAGKNTLPTLVQAKKSGLWTSHVNQSLQSKVKTAVAKNTLKALAAKLQQLPEGMVLQPQVAKMLEDQQKMTAEQLPMNWGYAEVLAYATLLNEGYSVRLSGQDSQRGTFAHRHAVLHDYQNGREFTPLQQLATDKVQFEAIDSILSEVAVLAFEYGYATTEPQTLTLWEAQFGDFANGAQVVIDQFISSGEQKWARLCGLVMLLPHGYEGMGPEHSSARLERYLQLCAQDNMQVCVPTTPAQVFHMLRRQMLRPARKPLIVMTPKSLLRHKLAVSTLDELSYGEFQLVIPEIEDLPTAKVQRVILCCGKVYYDLLEARRAQKIDDIAIIRLEQLYPFPQAELQAVLAAYTKAKQIIWCQEEPENQGAWYAVQRNLLPLLNKGQSLQYVGRSAAAAPAVGSSKLHAVQQKQLVTEALNISK